MPYALSPMSYTLYPTPYPIPYTRAQCSVFCVLCRPYCPKALPERQVNHVSARYRHQSQLVRLPNVDYLVHGPHVSFEDAVKLLHINTLCVEVGEKRKGGEEAEQLLEVGWADGKGGVPVAGGS
jgi:hypothetical protein